MTATIANTMTMTVQRPAIKPITNFSRIQAATARTTSASRRLSSEGLAASSFMSYRLVATGQPRGNRVGEGLPGLAAPARGGAAAGRGRGGRGVWGGAPGPARGLGRGGGGGSGRGGGGGGGPLPPHAR